MITDGARRQAAARLAGVIRATRELPLRVRNFELDKVLPKVAAVFDFEESLRRVATTDNGSALARSRDCLPHRFIVSDFEEVRFHSRGVGRREPAEGTG